MTKLYWVGGNAAWDATAGTKWALTSGGAGGQPIPTTADDVFFDNGAGTGNVTSITSAAVARSINFTGYVGTFTHTSGVVLLIGDGTPGDGNIALKMVAGMTYTLGDARAALKFVSTSATVQTITTGGKIFGDVLFDGVGGSWKMQDAWPASSAPTRTVTLINGTVDTNSFTMAWDSFTSNNSNVRTLTFGSSLINCNVFGFGFNLTNTTNLTITANTATLSSAGGFSAGAINLNGASIILNSPSGTGISQFGTGAGTITCANFTHNATSPLFAQMIMSSPLTCTGTATLSGSSTVDRLLINGVTPGTATSFTAAAFVLTNVDMVDIAFAGAGAPAAGSSLGDMGGCTGVSFTASVPQASTGTASFTWSTHGWTTRIPLPQDDVTIANAFVASSTITADMPRLGRTLDLSAATGGVTLTATGSNRDPAIYGSLILGAGVNNAVFTGAFNGLAMSGRGSHNITTAAVTIKRLALGLGIYALLDNLTTSASVSASTASFTCSGTLNAGANTVSVTRFTGSATTTIVNASGTWTLNGVELTTVFGPIKAGASSCGSMTINITGIPTALTGLSTQTFNGGGNVFGTLNHTMVNSGKSLTIVGSNTFTNLNLGPGTELRNTSSAIQTVSTGLTASGVPTACLFMAGFSNTAFVSVPDSAALSVVGDIGIAARVAFNDWTPSAIAAIVSKFGNAGQRSYEFRLDTAGKLNFRHTILGSTVVTATSTVATGIVDGTAAWVYMTRNAATGDVKFFTAADAAGIPGAWTQLGATVAGAASAIFDSTTDVFMGTSGTKSDFFTGNLYRAAVYSDITQTTKVLDADFTSKVFGADSFVESANGATVSIAGKARLGDGRLAITAVTPGTSGALVLPLGAVVDYVVLTDCVSQGGPSTFAGANSVDHGGNAGWWWGRTPFPKAVAA